MEEFFLMYEDMICSKFCKFRGELCEENNGCVLSKEVEELKKEYAIKVLAGEV